METDKIMQLAIETIQIEKEYAEQNNKAFLLTKTECQRIVKKQALYYHYFDSTMSSNDIDDYLRKVIKVAYAMSGENENVKQR